MIYPHTVLVERVAPATGTQDTDTGVYTITAAPAATLVYSGLCDAQDSARMRVRNGDSPPTENDPLTVYLPESGEFADDAITSSLVQGDQVTITFADGRVQVGSVGTITRLDGKFTVRWLDG